MKALLLPTCLLLLTACSSLPERDFFTLLTNRSTISIMWFGEQTATVTHNLRREKQHCIIELEYKAPTPGYKLEPVMVRQAYGSLINSEHSESLAPFITACTEKTMQLTVPATYFRHGGGPWDYSLRLNFTSPDGTTHASHDMRLNSDCPEPGALRSNPNFFDTTYDNNKKNLQELQRATLACSSMRLYTHCFHSGEKSTHTISPSDVATLRNVIARLQPVHTKLASINPAGTVELQMVNSDGKVIYELPTRSIILPNEVSPENVAFMGFYMLNPQDESTWNTIFSKFMR